MFVSTTKSKHRKQPPVTAIMAECSGIYIQVNLQTVRYLLVLTFSVSVESQGCLRRLPLPPKTLNVLAQKEQVAQFLWVGPLINVVGPASQDCVISKLDERAAPDHTVMRAQTGVSRGGSRVLG